MCVFLIAEKNKEDFRNKVPLSLDMNVLSPEKLIKIQSPKQEGQSQRIVVLI